MFVVTGATGNTGSVVARKLLQAGKQVIGIGRSAERLRELEQSGGRALVAQLTDAEKLSEAFRGAEGVYLMIPPNLVAPDFRAEQRSCIESYAKALEQSKVKDVVALSSFGADKAEGTGPVAGLYELEQRLSKIPNLNILFLRAGYFMENLLPQAALIQQTGKTLGPLRADLKLPMIATQDIGAAAADALFRREFSGVEQRELHGQRDLTMKEATEIIGRGIGKPELTYVVPPEEQLRQGMMQMGMSADCARLILEMAGALNSGHMRALEPRSPRNTTPTSLEMFVQQEFAPAYKGLAAA